MRSLKNFGITFAIVFVILGIVAIFVARYVADTVCGVFTGDAKNLEQLLNPTDSSGISGDDPDDRFSRELQGISFTWLMVLTDYRPDVYEDYFPANRTELNQIDDKFGLLGQDFRYLGTRGIALVHADVNRREYCIMTIPDITRVEVGKEDYTLSELYCFFGIDYLREKLESLTGMTIDYYSVMNCSELSSLANVIGGVECQIPLDIYSDGTYYVSESQVPAAIRERNKKYETTAAETTDAEDKDKDKDKKDDTTKEEETTEPLPEFEVLIEKGDSVKLTDTLEAALLYYDISDGILDETIIFQSFVQGVLKNLSESSESNLLTYLSGLDDKFRDSNIEGAAIQLTVDVLQAYEWMEIEISTFPGKYVPARGNQSAYYSPSVDEAVDYFYKYR